MTRSALCLALLAALCGAAAAGRAMEGPLSVGGVTPAPTGRELLQSANDCTRSVPHCAACRFQFFRGTVTRAICTRVRRCGAQRHLQRGPRGGAPPVGIGAGPGRAQRARRRRPAYYSPHNPTACAQCEPGYAVKQSGRTCCEPRARARAAVHAAVHAPTRACRPFHGPAAGRRALRPPPTPPAPPLAGSAAGSARGRGAGAGGGPVAP